MTDPSEGNAPSNPAGGGSDPSVSGGKPADGAEGGTTEDVGGKTHVLPPSDLHDRTLDEEAKELPKTVGLKPGEPGYVEPPKNLSEVTNGDDEGSTTEGSETDQGRETQTIGAGDVGDAGKELGLEESTATGGGGDKPPHGGATTATGGEDDGQQAADRFIEEMVKKVLGNTESRKAAGAEEKAQMQKCVALIKQLLLKSKGKDDLLERLLLKCRSLKELIDDLKFAMRAGGNFSMSKLVDALVALYALLENQTLDAKKHREDPIFAEAEAYLAADQNREAEDFLANDKTA